MGTALRKTSMDAHAACRMNISSSPMLMICPPTLSHSSGVSVARPFPNGTRTARAFLSRTRAAYADGRIFAGGAGCLDVGGRADLRDSDPARADVQHPLDEQQIIPQHAYSTVENRLRC